MKKFLKVILFIFLFLIVALLVLRFFLSGIIVSQVNKQLEATLNAEAKLGSVSLGLMKGYVAIHDFEIAQPEGFGEGHFLKAKNGSVKVSLGSLNSGLIEIEDVSLDHVNIHIVKKPEGTNSVMNVEKLAKAPAEDSSGTPPADAPPPTEETEAAKPPPDIKLASLTIQNTTVRYTDSTLGDIPLDLTLTNITLNISNLLVKAEPGADDAPANIRFTTDLPQPSGLMAHIGLATKVGTIKPEPGAIPDVEASLRLCGLELDTLKAVMVPGAAMALGGNGIDTIVDVRLANKILNCPIKIITDKGVAHDIPIDGPTTNLNFAAAAESVLFSQIKRPGKMIANVAGDVVDGATEVVGTAVETGEKLVTGAKDTVGKFGTGLLNVGKGLLKGDIKGATEGLEEATVGTVNEATGAVTDAATTASEGVADAAGDVLVNEAPKKWRETIDARFEATFSKAEADLKSAAWPPAIAEKATE